LGKELQAQITHLIKKNSQTVPIILGDMNAAFYDDDRSSCLHYSTDVMYRQFVAESQLSPTDAKPEKYKNLTCLDNGDTSRQVETKTPNTQKV